MDRVKAALAATLPQENLADIVNMSCHETHNSFQEFCSQLSTPAQRQVVVCTSSIYYQHICIHYFKMLICFINTAAVLQIQMLTIILHIYVYIYLPNLLLLIHIMLMSLYCWMINSFVKFVQLFSLLCK